MFRTVGSASTKSTVPVASARAPRIPIGQRPAQQHQADRSGGVGAPRSDDWQLQLSTVVEDPAGEAETARGGDLSTTVDAPGQGAGQSTAQKVSGMSTHPAFAAFQGTDQGGEVGSPISASASGSMAAPASAAPHVVFEQPDGGFALGSLDSSAANDTPAPPTTARSQPQGERGAGEAGARSSVGATANDPPKAVEAKEDMVVQRAKLRRLLQEHTNMKPKEIDRMLKGFDKGIDSVVKAIEDKYGKDNIPQELLREIVDLVKSYIKNMEDIAKGFADVLKTSAAR